MRVSAMESYARRLSNAPLAAVVRAWEHILAALQSALLSLQGFARYSCGEAFNCGFQLRVVAERSAFESCVCRLPNALQLLIVRDCEQSLAPLQATSH